MDDFFAKNNGVLDHCGISFFLSFGGCTKLECFRGSACGAVGRVVVSDNRDQWFKSQDRQSFLKISVDICQLQFRIEENKEKEAGIRPFKNEANVF